MKDLTLSEAALIAGILQRPHSRTPIADPEGALRRRDLVLGRMAEEKYITHEEAEAARREPLELHLRRARPSVAPYFLEEVRKYLEREYGSQRIYQGGLRVYTTLDPELQRAAVRALRNGLRILDRRARGFRKPTESVLEDGLLPDPLRLPEWDWPFGEGDVVRGVVVASDRAHAVVHVGEYRSRVGPQDVGWSRPGRMDDVLPRGTVASFRILSLTSEGERRDARLRLEPDPEVEGAFLALDVKSGAVRAMVGGYDFERSKFNRATQAKRQVGSAFKPIVYAAAIETLGWTPTTTLVDAPLEIEDPWDKSIWSPRNYDHSYLGPITLRRAVEQSRNVPAVKTLQAVGLDTGIEYAKRLGLSGDLPPYLPIALGAGEARLVEMVAAFATFANQGLRMRPFLIERIEDRNGNLIEETRPRAIDAIRADAAYLVTSLLQGVVQRGTATRARRLERPIAGKTGTTNDYTDAWFIGYEPSLAAGVWVGFDDKVNPDGKLNSLGRGADGSRAALPIWMEFWKEVTAERPVEEFPIPGNIVFVPVDASGRPGAPGEPGVKMEAFVSGTEPRARMATPRPPQ